jgi:PAS domain S-box-containing protein
MDDRRALYDSLPLPVAIHVSGTFVYINPAAMQLVGVGDATEVIGRPVLEFVHPDSRVVVIQRMAAAMTSSEPLPPIEERFVRTDGQPLSVEVTAVPLEFEGQRASMVLIRDVTEVRRALDEQRRLTERLGVLHEIDHGLLAARSTQALADAALQHLDRLVPCDFSGVTTFDVDHDQCEVIALHTRVPVLSTVGRRFPLEAFGPLDDFLQGQDFYTPDATRESTMTELGEIAVAAGVRSYVTVPLLSRGALLGGLSVGSTRPGAFTREHMDAMHQVALPLAVAIEQDRLRRDLEQHAATLEAAVLERTAELRELVSELEAFTYSVSHDLRAPLRAIRGFADALVEDFPEALGPVGTDYAERLRNASTRMSQLIDDLLAYSRLRRGELPLQAVELTDCVHEALLHVEPQLVARRAIVDVEPDLPRVTGHAVVLTQVLANLLSNAVKYVPPERTPTVHVRAEVIDDRVRVVVDDNGIGVEPEFQQRIFRVFERLHGGDVYGPGSGVGLAVVKRGIERLGGRVGVDSTPGQGSHFWFEIASAGAGSGDPQTPGR